MAMRISSVCDYIVVLFALHSIIRTAYYTNIIYIYLSCMEHLGVQKYMRYYINYNNVSASSSSDLLGRRLDGDRHEIRP